MIVVDTNVLAYLYLLTEFSARAEALLERDADWAAPALWRSEFRNILAGCMRRRALSFAEACALQAEAEDLLAGNEHEVDSMTCSNSCAPAIARPTTASSPRWPCAWA